MNHDLQLNSKSCKNAEIIIFLFYTFIAYSYTFMVTKIYKNA